LRNKVENINIWKNKIKVLVLFSDILILFIVAKLVSYNFDEDFTIFDTLIQRNRLVISQIRQK
jgi:hypothetical protein